MPDRVIIIPIVYAPYQGQTKKQYELQDAFARSHAARISHSRRKDQKTAKRPELEETEIEQVPRSTAVRGRRGTEDESALTLVNPRTILGQSRLNPFNNDELQTLPIVAHESLEYTWNNLWPKTSPGISGAALKSLINEWKRAVVQSPLQFHTSVSTAASLCYSLSTDPHLLKTLLFLRWKHQTLALKIIRGNISTTTGPVSDDLIDNMNRLGAQGGSIFTARIVRGFPQTPLADVFPLRLYGQFEPCLPHFIALRHLIQQRGGLEEIPAGISHPISLAGVALACKNGDRPLFSMHRDLRFAAQNIEVHFDRRALELLSTMGSGFDILQDTHPRIVELALRAVELTVALDQSWETRPGHIFLSQISLLTTVFQYDLYSLNSPKYGEAGLKDADIIFHISRLSLQIFSDIVLFPSAEVYGTKLRLATELRKILLIYHRTRIPANDIYWNMILWAVVMGTVSAEVTKYRAWYLRTLIDMVLEVNLSWDDFRSILQEFLWWDYTFEEHVQAIWKDAWGGLSEETLLALSI